MSGQYRAQATTRSVKYAKHVSPFPQQEKLIAYLKHHRQCFKDALQQLSQPNISNFMTILVIALAMALPVSLFIATSNLNFLTANWQSSNQMSLFMKPHVTLSETQQLAEALRSEPSIENVTVISKTQALQEFEDHAGFGDVLNDLPTNPLPHVVTLIPKANLTPDDIMRLELRAKQLIEVESLQFDMNWMKRLFGLIDLSHRLIWLISAFVAAGVCLVIANTIRLMINNRRDEIEITLLIGATESFVRRPFLYLGTLLGLLGGLMACLLTFAAAWALDDQVALLASLYQSDFFISWLTIPEVCFVLASGFILGGIGAWLVVSYTLNNFLSSNH